MLTERAKNPFTGEKLTCISFSLLALMILPVEAAKTTSSVEYSKQLNKKRKKEEKLKSSDEKSEKSEKSRERSEKAIEKAEKTAEKEAEAAQAREKSLPAHEDHHKLGAHDRVDKGFDFNTNSSKSP